MGLSHRSLLMFLLSLSFHIVTLLLGFSLSAPAIGGNVTDQQALLEIKAKITHDPLKVMRLWNGSTHFCQWYGVTCGRKHQRVTALDLNSLKLSGSISPHIGNLSFLRELYLENNSLTHEIPSQIGHLRRLRVLYLNNNSISGVIPPNISHCFRLVFMKLGRNKLEGEIPEQIGILTELQLLSLGRNFLSGSIPQSMGNLSSLQEFYAHENNLFGNLIQSIGQLANLKVLSLGVNSFSGIIPLSIFNMSSITTFDIGQNYFQGYLPSDLGNSLPNLNVFFIGENEFIGSIPISISNASNLEQFQLTSNNLTGQVPSLQKLHMLNWFTITSNHLGNGGTGDLSFLSTLTNATNLQLLAINDNNFAGKLPEKISNLSKTLEKFWIDDNQIFGSIPTGIDVLVKLNDFQAQRNRLSGTIPSSIGKLKNLQVLYLSFNNLVGLIPVSLGNMTSLIDLELQYNNLQGSIPSSLGNCKRLLGLLVSQNNLSGSIPLQITNLSSLSLYLGLSQNHLSGSLPTQVGNLKNLEYLDVSENMLSGEVPSSLGSCTSLEVLNLSVNFFQEVIPSSFGSLRGIKELNVSHNNFSGEIPQFLTGFKLLEILDLSYNNFEGAVPIDGVLKNATVTSVVGNRNLCGGIPEFQLPICKLQQPKKRRSVKLKIIISVTSTILLVAIAFACSCLFWSRKKRKEPLTHSPRHSLLRVSYHSLFKATNGFSSANLIGTGSFGAVYKGVLDQERNVIAVKVLNLTRQGASKSFMAECEALKNIRHRNLVKVLTACSSVDYHDNDFKALVYEFMVNGSMDGWLHRPGTRETTEPMPNLSLIQRLNIAIDVASAIEYLHHHGETKIIHCDLKPSNILLDSEMVGHVGDFGLVKFLPEMTSAPSANQSSSMGIRGTIGYAPPEYGIGNEVSTQGDTYSFGIVLLEMFTGRKPTDNMFSNDLGLHGWVKDGLPERVPEIVDPVLLGDRNGEETSTDAIRYPGRARSEERILDCLTSIFAIGVACSVELPTERMSINAVVGQLISTKEKLLGTGIQRRL